MSSKMSISDTHHSQPNKRNENGLRFTNPSSQKPSDPDRHSNIVSNALREATYRRLRLGRQSLGGGVTPIDDFPSSSNSHSSSSSSTSDDKHDLLSHIRYQRQRNIAQILPVTDVQKMTVSHWIDIYAIERRYLPIDWYHAKEGPILGVRQNNVNRDHRHRIVKWMSEACSLFKWSSQTFFTAVHAWDFYMTVVSHEVTTNDLAKLSAACLYFGAQLVESAADENVKTLEEFTEMCPEVGSASALREIQAHLVDTLQGISLVRRTPLDFLLLFLAQMQIAPSPCLELFESLLHQNFIDVVWDLVLGVSLTIYANGVVLDGMPGSRWVAGSILRLLEFACPTLRTDSKTRDILCRCVFHIPVAQLENQQTTVMDSVIKSVWRNILDNGFNETTETKNLKQPQRKPKPYDVIRHHQPAQFPQWPITFPTDRTVQEVSTRLRAISFDTCTPPNVNATGTSISASKRAAIVDNKSRRHSSVTTDEHQMKSEQHHPQNENEFHDGKPKTKTTCTTRSTPYYPAVD